MHLLRFTRRSRFSSIDWRYKETDMDMTALGIADLIAAALAAGIVSGVLSWRFPMAPLAAAVVAGGVAAGLVLVVVRPLPGGVVLIGGLLAAGAGLLHDRAMIPRWALIVLELAIAAGTLALAVPIFLLRTSIGLELPAPVLILLAALLVALSSVGLRRADRLPGLAAGICAAVAGLATFLGVLGRIPDYPTLWWLAALTLVTAGLSMVGRARAAPLGSTGTSYLAITLGILILTLAAFGGLSSRFG